MTIVVRSLQDDDRASWQRLYLGYADFYRASVTSAGLERLWDWLHDPDHEVEGLVAVRDVSVVGLAHFRRMPSPLRGTDIGFLDDLFVEPQARGSGAGEALILEVRRIAAGRGWPLVRWITAEDNYRARTLYDRVATKTSWKTYEIQV